MIALSSLNTVSAEEFIRVLGGIYEHSEWVPRAIFEKQPFASLDHLASELRETVERADSETKLALIRAHPDLAGKLARAGKLTEESTREQAGLGLDRLSDEEYDQFSEKNGRYREIFGFPFIICARLSTKDGVLEAFDSRLRNSVEEEISEALDQIHKIAQLRLQDTVTP
jgi:2-oxo-4-hydroxy-4-carboxy-5-ureidoimidazoline decarboxylase